MDRNTQPSTETSFAQFFAQQIERFPVTRQSDYIKKPKLNEVEHIGHTPPSAPLFCERGLKTLF